MKIEIYMDDNSILTDRESSIEKNVLLLILTFNNLVLNRK